MLLNCPTHGSLILKDCIKAGVHKGTQKYRCKACYKLIRDKNYAANKEAIYIKTRAWKTANPERSRELNKKSYMKSYKKSTKSITCIDTRDARTTLIKTICDIAALKRKIQKDKKSWKK